MQSRSAFGRDNLGEGVIEIVVEKDDSGEYVGFTVCG
jgi:hypothetical protein